MNMNVSAIRIISALLLLTTLPARAQNFTEHTDKDLKVRESVLMQKAKTSPTGESGEKIDDFGSHWVLLMARARTGESELHELWADEIIVRSGELILVVGGKLTGAHSFNGLPGEFHGTGLDGGEAHVLRTGDVAYVPANVPHWMKVTSSPGTTVLIYKEREK